MDHDLLAALAADGWLCPPRLRREQNPLALDLQFRREADGARSWLSVYPGLSSVLEVDVSHYKWRLRSHPTYKAACAFDRSWSSWQGAGALQEAWAGVEQYFHDLLAHELLVSSTEHEGRVHTLMCAGASRDYRIIQREAVISFPNTAAKKAIVGGIRNKIMGALGAVGATKKWWPGIANHSADSSRATASTHSRSGSSHRRGASFPCPDRRPVQHERPRGVRVDRARRPPRRVARHTRHERCP